MDALSDDSMFKFLRKTLLYIILAPYLVLGIGMAANQAVIIANNDTFPVRINPVKLYAWTHKGESIVVIPANAVPSHPDGLLIMDNRPTGGKVHSLMTEKTRLNWLADNFDFNEDIVSIGDMLIDFGYWMLRYTPFIWGGAILRKLYVE